MAEIASTVVVTGAGGWLGRALVEMYHNHQSRGDATKVVCLVHQPGDVSAIVSALADTIGQGTTVHQVDLLDSMAIDEVLTDLDPGFDVIHTAGVIHAPRIDDLFRVNVQGTRHLLQSALRHGARRVVHVSSNSPFGTNPDPDDAFGEFEPYNPYMAYGRSKMEAEFIVFDHVERGLDAVIVRPPWFYGPHQPLRQTRFFSMVKAGRFPVFGRGEQRRSMVYVGNLALGIEGARSWSGEPGRAWWIADAEPYTVTEIVETVGRALRDEGLWVHQPMSRLPEMVARVAERIDRTVQRTGRYIQSVHVLGEMNKTIACDISAARRDLGYAPPVSLYEGMRASIRWCLSQGIVL